ncbi:MAG: YadA C-terminal domain-containing protein [Pseudomonadota bacterium]
MTIHTKITILGLVAATTFFMTAPISLQAQALDVTCDASAGGSSWATDLCDNADMTEVETAVNQNANDIDANTAAAASAQNTANAAQTAANNAQAAADDAQQTADDAEAAAANAQATADGAVAVNNTQQTEIDANTAGVANNAANIQTNTNNIQSNTAAIVANAARIQTNTDDIATNAADIVDLQDGLSDLRNDLNKGLAMSNAMEVFAPDPGSNFRLNIGTGFHDGEAAFAITGAGRVGAMGDTILYLGVAAAEGTAGGKAGVSFQW